MRHLRQLIKRACAVQAKQRPVLLFFNVNNNATFFQQGIISVVTNCEKQRCRRESVCGCMQTYFLTLPPLNLQQQYLLVYCLGHMFIYVFYK